MKRNDKSNDTIGERTHFVNQILEISNINLEPTLCHSRSVCSVYEQYYYVLRFSVRFIWKP